MTTRITKRVLDEIRAHAESSYPEECCGLLIADADHRIIESVRATNAYPGVRHHRYDIDPVELFRADQTATERGLKIAGVYHSHPDHPARPSEFDREHAWPWYSYVIVSVDAGRPQLMTSWLLAEDRSHFDPEEIVTRESASSAT